MAVFVSGQFNSARVQHATEAICAAEDAFSSLSALWRGQYRYGVAASMVRFFVATEGRPVLDRLSSARSTADILFELGTTEEALLAAWRQDTCAQPHAAPSP